MRRLLARVVRVRCPFCFGNRACNTCGGSGWVWTTEPDP